MAINTAARRRSVSGIPFLPPGVTPSSSKGVDWRLSVGYTYIGFIWNIDTAEKRRAAAGIPFPLAVSVTPNVLKDTQWRRQAGWGYMVTLIGRSQGRQQFTTERRVTHTTARGQSYTTS